MCPVYSVTHVPACTTETPRVPSGRGRKAAPPSYIELRCRSAFSFLSGASLPEDLIEYAAILGYPALALGDRDGVYGAPRFHQAATRAGLRAIIGAELTLGNRPLAPSLVRRGKGASPVTEGGPHGGCLYLLAADRTGYQNLCKLITQAKLRAPKGASAATWDDFEGSTDGLICLARDAVLLTTKNLPLLQRLFPGRLYIDLQRHLDPDEERLNGALITMAEQFRIPLVVTNDVRHAAPSGRRLLDVLTCIREKTTLDAAGRKLLRNAERHLKRPAEMIALFPDLPAAIANTERIAEQCEFTLADLGYRFPEYPLPPGETPGAKGITPAVALVVPDRGQTDRARGMELAFDEPQREGAARMRHRGTKFSQAEVRHGKYASAAY